MGNLEGIIKGLGNLWEMFPKGKFGDDVRKVHEVVVDMEVTIVAMADGSDVKVCCNFFDGERAIYAACTAVWYMIIGRFV